MSRLSESPPPPLEDMGRVELLKFARTMQSNLNTQTARANAAEKRALADATNVPRGRPCKRVRPRTRIESDDENDAEFEDPEKDAEDKQAAVRGAGIKWGIVHGIWFAVPAAKVLKTPLNNAYDEKKRFDNRANKVQGELREIMDVLPEEYRAEEERKKAWVGAEVCISLRCSFYHR